MAVSKKRITCEVSEHYDTQFKSIKELYPNESNGSILARLLHIAYPVMKMRILMRASKSNERSEG